MAGGMQFSPGAALSPAASAAAAPAAVVVAGGAAVVVGAAAAPIYTQALICLIPIHFKAEMIKSAICLNADMFNSRYVLDRYVMQ